jgi:hypothetical protein
MNDKTEVQDLTSQPRIIEIFMEGQNPIVIVSVQNMFAALYPDGATNGDPGAWGIILADTVRHVVAAHRGALMRFSQKGLGPEPPSEEVILDRLMEILVDEVQKPSATTKGTTVVTPKDPSKRD